LLLPVNIYLQHDKFGTFMGSMEMPNPLFLLVFVYPFIRRNIDEIFRKSLDILAILTGILSIAWSLGSQQIRFLLPMFPGLSIIASLVMVKLYKNSKLQLLSRSLVISCASGMVFATLIYMGLYINLVQPEKVLFCLESKADFLRRNVRDFTGIENINRRLTTNIKVMLLWDGRGYYCDRGCLPDIDQSRWISLLEQSKDYSILSLRLQEQNITHLYFNNEDVSYFLLKHDQVGLHKKAFLILTTEFYPACMEKIYTDEWSVLYEFKPKKSSCK
jgi:hypothetical protein